MTSTVFSIMSFGVADLPALFSFGGSDKKVLTELCTYSKFIFSINCHKGIVLLSILLYIAFLTFS